MEASLLKTKLQVPPVKTYLVPRPRLMELLNEARRYNLILISAPAGFGKTTFLSQWIHQEKPAIPAAWLSLENGENDPVRFWSYFIAALQTIQPALREIFPDLIRSSQAPPVETLLTAIINQLTDIAEDFILILDDYQFIKTPALHAGMVFLLEHLPPRMHLVLASRVDPPFPLERWRGRGVMLEIRTDDLRFTPGEATSLARGWPSLQLSGEDIQTIHGRTEGWAVGLKMALLTLQSQKDVHKFIETFTGNQGYIMDYLLAEVLRQQTKEARDFLLQTSVLEHLTAPLCNTLTGRNDSQKMLEFLEKTHLFLVPLDDSRQWFRYEHLFDELLRHQLEVESGVEKVKKLRRSASQWYEEQNSPDEAVQYALLAGDWRKTVLLIEKYGLEKARGGEWATLLNWMRDLPPEVLQAHWQLCIWNSLALMMAGHVDNAESKLKILEEEPQQDAHVKGEIATVKTYLAMRRNDIPRTIELAREALSLLPPDQLDACSGVNMALGFIYWKKGQFKEAEPVLNAAYEAARQVGNHINAAMSLSLLANILSAGGRLRQAAEMHTRAVDVAAPFPAAAFSHWSLGEILYEWNDLDTSADHAKRAAELAQLEGNTELLMWVLALLGRVNLARGDQDGASKMFQQVDSSAREISSLSSARAVQCAWHIWLAIKQDDLDAASKWESLLAEDAEALPPFLKHFPVRLLIAQSRKPAAAERLQVLYEQTVQGSAHSNLISVRVYQTLAAATDNSALEFLAEALDIAEPEGYIRTFVDEGKLLAPLLRKAFSQGIKPDYAGKLLTIIENEKKQNLSALHSILSERENEVLQLLAGGLSYQQIADRLYISINTSKIHIRHLFEKLNAQNRTQALSRARELRLL